jgi:hypothetical protein
MYLKTTIIQFHKISYEFVKGLIVNVNSQIHNQHKRKRL